MKKDLLRLYRDLYAKHMEAIDVLGKQIRELEWKAALAKKRPPLSPQEKERRRQQMLGLVEERRKRHVAKIEAVASPAIRNLALAASGNAVADAEQVRVWAAAHGIIFRGWDDLPEVNAIAERMGLLPFARKFPMKGARA